MILEEYPLYKITLYSVINIETGKIKTPTLDKSVGYYVISIVNRYGIKRKEYFHRLLAKAFIVNPENKSCVNHIDGNKLNNSIDNLEWSSYSENNKHAFDTGLKGISEYHKEVMSRIGKESTNIFPAKKIKWSHPEIGLFIGSASELSREYDLNRSSLSRVSLGKQKSHRGWTV